MDPGVMNGRRGLARERTTAWPAPPALRDLALAWLAAGLVASLVSSWAALGATYVVKVLFTALLCTILGGLAARGTDAAHRFSAADRITLTRAVLVILVIAMSGEPPTAHLATLIFLMAALAAALDAVDGLVARRTGRVTAFGARFDMETDALLILALSLLAWTWDKAGVWILLAGLARYLFLAGAALAPCMNRELPPSRRRQVVCVIQVVTLLACIAPWVPSPTSALVAGAGLAALLYSFSVDVHWLCHRDPLHPNPGGMP